MALIVSTPAVDLLSIPEVVEPGVFETPDRHIPEFRPYHVMEERDHPDIDRSSLSIQAATSAFKRRVGESDPGAPQMLSQYRRALYRTYVTHALTGYGQATKETPAKLSGAHVEKLPKPSPIVGRAPREIVNQLYAIQLRAAHLRLKLPGTPLAASSSEGAHLMAKLNGLFASPDLPPIPATLKPTPYPSQVAHALELEARVASLEGLLGPETLIKADIPKEPGLAAHLASMRKLLARIQQPEHPLNIGNRLKGLLGELDRLMGLRDTLKQLGRDPVLFSRDAGVDSETKAKIDRLLGLFNASEVYLALGARLVARLKQLAGMHHELVGFGRSLDQLIKRMDAIRAAAQVGQAQYHQLHSRLRACQTAVNADLTRLDAQLGAQLAKVLALNGTCVLVAWAALNFWLAYG
ncbi:hypothetical protein L0F63_005913 [Massospora cicadina]|nr:hypothetical protein L0F63_005913 [Massospora cicadina]